MERDAPAEILTDARASDLVVACEASWRAIQAHHPELPDVVMLLGTGVERGRLVKLGHWWGGRWLADGEVRGEVLLAGEALHLEPEAVFEVLLHEAAHGINAARGIKDTSRGGRYHNARFKSTAIEVGLTVEQMDPYGFAQTAMGPASLDRYGADVARLAAAMRIARRIPETALTQGEAGGQLGGGLSGPQSGESPREKVRPAECGCGRRLRMAPSVLAQGPVTCGNCGSEFLVGRQSSRSTPDDHPASDSFVERRTTQLGTPAEQDPLAAVLHEAVSGEDGLDVVLRLGAWRARLSTDPGHPLQITGSDDRDRWDQLARAVLATDGVLHGPPVAAADGLELRVGDRVVVELPSDGDRRLDLPDDGALGVVARVDPLRGSLTIAFPTAGTFDVGAGSAEAAALAYSYCEPEPSSQAAHPSRIVAPARPLLRLCPEPGVDLDFGIDL